MGPVLPRGFGLTVVVSALEVVGGDAAPPESDDDAVRDGCVAVPDVCVDVEPWVIVDEEFTSADVCPDCTPLVTVWSPPPMLTPGLMFAPTFASVLLSPTFASTPTFGLTSTLRPGNCDWTSGHALTRSETVSSDNGVEGDTLDVDVSVPV
ncbi:MAG: hypothetical protein FJZ38_09535 [Candidatus Rokubacteria bacterium]|nr:hypothetical protein [Candidatus Rokubacteria bacterium]